MTATAEAVLKGESFLLISHVSPDGDTLGSAAALYGLLKGMGKVCTWRCDGEVPSDLMNIDAISALTRLPDAAFDTVIAVDCGSIDRLGACAEAFSFAKTRIVIDHHKTNTGFGDINCIKHYPATAQCVHELLNELQRPMTADIAEGLYVGYITDTGRFSYREVTRDTMKLVSELYGTGIDIPALTLKIYGNRTETQTRLLGRALENLKVFKNVTVMTLSYEDFADLDAFDCDTEGIVNYALEVQGTQKAAFIYEKKRGITKVSLRAKAGQDVSAIAVSYGGGGHTLAAGCTLNKPCKEAMDEILPLLEG